MASKTVVIELRSDWGNIRAYPIDENAKAFAEIAGTTTLTPRALKAVKKLGYEVQTQQPDYLAQYLREGGRNG